MLRKFCVYLFLSLVGYFLYPDDGGVCIQKCVHILLYKQTSKLTANMKQIPCEKKL